MSIIKSASFSNINGGLVVSIWCKQAGMNHIIVIDVGRNERLSTDHNPTYHSLLLAFLFIQPVEEGHPLPPDLREHPIW